MKLQNIFKFKSAVSLHWKMFWHFYSAVYLGTYFNIDDCYTRGQKSHLGTYIKLRGDVPPLSPPCRTLVPPAIWKNSPPEFQPNLTHVIR